MTTSPLSHAPRGGGHGARLPGRNGVAFGDGDQRRHGGRRLRRGGAPAAFAGARQGDHLGQQGVAGAGVARAPGGPRQGGVVTRIGARLRIALAARDRVHHRLQPGRQDPRSGRRGDAAAAAGQPFRQAPLEAARADRLDLRGGDGRLAPRRSEPLHQAGDQSVPEGGRRPLRRRTGRPTSHGRPAGAYSGQGRPPTGRRRRRPGRGPWAGRRARPEARLPPSPARPRSGRRSNRRRPAGRANRRRARSGGSPFRARRGRQNWTRSA